VSVCAANDAQARYALHDVTQPMFLLRNPIQRYAWGSRTAIPDVLGRAPIPDGEAPWAELWMGAHASAPSTVEIDGREVGLDRLIAERPEEILGPRAASQFSGRLPFLFKLIAAERPLSIQCHPDLAAARTGFARENRLGVPLAARERNYRDDSHKPELLVALGRFEALVGFRPPREIGERLAAAGVRELERERAGLELAGGLAGFLAGLLRLDASARRALLDQAAAGLAGDGSAEAAWVRRLMIQYPGDPAALAPLFLHLIELAADQAIYLGAGVLHAYLGGVGLELMASSDNVLRGGLTDKHIDVDELVAIMRAEPTAPAVIEPSRADDRLLLYAAPAREFQLGFVDVDRPYERGTRSGPEIAFSLAQHCRLVQAGAALDLERGRAALIPAGTGSYRVEGQGGRVYIAAIP
jgi:mannose-6-phosphate isomerase